MLNISIPDYLIERVLEGYLDRGWVTPTNLFQFSRASTHEDDAKQQGSSLEDRLKHGWIRQASSDRYAIGDEKDLPRVIQHVRDKYPNNAEIEVASPNFPNADRTVCMQHGLRGRRAPFGMSKCGFFHDR